MYRSAILTAILITVLAVSVTDPAFAQPSGGIESDPTASAQVVNLDVNPFKVWNRASHVANGVAMRNATEGWIHLRGVPVGRRVLKAFLYWNLADGAVSGAPTAAATFNGNRILGTKVADSADACWGNVGNHSYRADVTKFVPPKRPNGFYEVVLDFVGNTSTTGQNPWSPVEAQKRRFNGATLFVIYKSSTTSTVRLYDALSGSMFTSSGTFTLSHPALGPGAGIFTMTGADGQRGSGHDNSLSNETTVFNGTQEAGPPVASSDWDGSAGWPLTQLWDVHTHLVNLGSGSSTVVYTSPGDCLVPVAFAIEG